MLFSDSKMVLCLLFTCNAKYLLMLHISMDEVMLANISVGCVLFYVPSVWPSTAAVFVHRQDNHYVSMLQIACKTPAPDRSSKCFGDFRIMFQKMYSFKEKKESNALTTGFQVCLCLPSTLKTVWRFHPLAPGLWWLVTYDKERLKPFWMSFFKMD